MRILVVIMLLFLLGCEGLQDTPKGHYTKTIELVSGPVTLESEYPIFTTTGSYDGTTLEVYSQFYQNGIRYWHTIAKYSMHQVVKWD